ncbi:MAG: glycosyltransferase family 8 protein [Lentisphaeria bacterium]
MPSPISIALGADERYVPGLLVTAISILFNTAPEQPVDFFILDAGITGKSWRRLQRLITRYSPLSTLMRLKPDLSLFRDCPSLARGTNSSLSCYARLLLPELVQRDRLLYFDVDMLVLKDVRELWALGCSHHTAMAVYEPGVTLARDCSWLASDDPDRQLPYFNSGAMVLNLAAWRAHGHTATVTRLVREHGKRMVTHDQTVLNYLLRHETGQLDVSWNCFCVGDMPAAVYMNPAGLVVHITHSKPWLTFKNLPGCLLWLMFYNRYVGTIPATLRFGLLWRTWKWSNFRSVLRILLESCLLKAGPPARRLLQFWLDHSPEHQIKAHWLRIWRAKDVMRQPS